MLLLVIYLIIAFLLSIYSFHKYTSRNFNFWKKRQIPYLKPKPFVGNLLDVCLGRCDVGHQFQKLYNQCDAPFFGAFAFSKPILIIRDPELLKEILIKNFDCFVNRNVLVAKHDPAAAHMLFNQKGEAWKIMRTAISPLFSTSKLKNMFSDIDDISRTMQRYIEILSKDRKYLEAKELCCLYSTDVITKCAFGINANSFTADKPQFREASAKLFDSRWSTTIRLISYFFLHSAAKIFKFNMFDPKATNFLANVLRESIEIRESKKILRKDILSTIIELKKNDTFRRNMQFEGAKELSPALNFFVAGSETIASTLSFALYELCMNPEVQEKLRANIKETVEKRDGQLNYESLTEMEYLNSVINETLRKYPSLSYLDRVCTKNFKIPGTDFIIEEGVIVTIPMLGLHKDPLLYPDPEKFIPERFHGNRKDCSYLPFGRGPRMCIGDRLGLLTVKLALVRILSEFDVLKCEGTPDPIVFNPGAIMLASNVGLPIRFRKIETNAQ